MQVFYSTAGARYSRMRAFYYRYERRMQMKAKPVPPERQYELIMECRSSGMSDYQWCEQHGINPGTFYNWVSKLRKKSCFPIPDATCRKQYAATTKQDVVKLEIVPENKEIVTLDASSDKETATIEVLFGSATIRVKNDADPVLLKQLIQSFGELLC